jgi:hypothetical protein
MHQEFGGDARQGRGGKKGQSLHNKTDYFVALLLVMTFITLLLHPTKDIIRPFV